MFDFLKIFNNFIDQGGPIVLVLFFISMYLFILIAAKFKFLFFDISETQEEFENKMKNLDKDQYYLLNSSIHKSDFKSVVSSWLFFVVLLLRVALTLHFLIYL